MPRYAVLAILLALLFPASALAGAARLGEVVTDTKYGYTSPAVLFVAAPGERNAITLTLSNQGSQSAHVSLKNVYSDRTVNMQLQAGHRGESTFELNPTFGWYDFVVTSKETPSFQWRLAGHCEDGRPSISDPLLGRQT